MLFAPYYRVSHDTERGISIEIQQETVTRWAATHGHTLTTAYIDQGKSAYTDNLAKRPAFQQMLADAHERRFQGVIVYKFDRFARQLHVFATVMHDLKQRGISVQSATEGNDPFLVDMLGAMAQHYSRMLSDRMKDTRHFEASQGKHVGPVPVGYNRVNGVLIPNEYAAAYLYAVDLYLTGTLGAQSIAVALNTAGYTMPTGQPFKSTQVEEMLKNPVYAGIVRCKGEQFPGLHEPLIDAATWEQLQAMQAQRSHRRTRTTAHYPLLSGLGVCAKCGASLWHQPYATGARYYVCATSVNKGHGPIPGLICTAGKSEAYSTEATVLGWLHGLAFTPRLLTEARQTLRSAAPPIPLDANELDQRIKRLARAYADGAYSDAEYQTRKDALVALRSTPSTAPGPDLDAVMMVLSDLPSLFHDATPAERRALLGELVSDIYITRGRVLAFRPTSAAEPLFQTAKQGFGWVPNDAEILTYGVNMGRVGFEPTAMGLKGPCSTTELPTRM